ncbi:MAG: thiolase family protein [Candidatus Bathyarchaeia archaeon]
MRKVAILGSGLTKYGKSDLGIIDLLSEASIKAFEDSNTQDKNFDSVFVGNMSSAEYEGICGIHNALVSELSLEPAFACKIENTSGSGGAAVLAGFTAIASGMSDLTLVAGGEKMTGVSTEMSTDIIASLTHPEEYKQGATLPSFAGLLARYYMEKYNAPREALAKIAVKNHYNGSLNPQAQFHKIISIRDALESPIIADPLRLFDFCPVSDGAAAMILAPADEAAKYVDHPVLISGIAGATDTHAVHEREDLSTAQAVKKAGQKAYQMASKTPEEIDVAELHDMSTIMELVQSEDLDFFKKGEAWKAVMEGETELKGRLPINTSGGLKAKGHPLGATGVSQIIEIQNQILGRCEARQVKSDVGLACNVGGFGNSAVVAILERI